MISSFKIIFLANVFLIDAQFANEFWFHRFQGNERHHYFKSWVSTSWTLAEQDCVLRGGHLVTISSSNEESYIIQQVPYSLHWIGLNVTSRGHFWTSGDALTYTNYQSTSDMEETDEHYAFLLENISWDAFVSSRSYRFICEVVDDNCNVPNCDISKRCSANSCECFEGYFGESCEINLASEGCASNPCLNGNCRQYSSYYSCSCNTGWEGTNCETDRDECSIASYCRNGGTCVNTPGSYNCTCAPGFTGVNCATNINDCASHPCVQGDCRDGVNFYSCVCSQGFRGTHCDEEVEISNKPSETEARDTNNNNNKTWLIVATVFGSLLMVAVFVAVGFYVFNKMKWGNVRSETLC